MLRALLSIVMRGGNRPKIRLILVWCVPSTRGKEIGIQCSQRKMMCVRVCLHVWTGPFISREKKQITSLSPDQSSLPTA